MGYMGAHCELDIDECVNEKPCDQMCHNTDGSFYCTCRLGFILHSDRQSCKKIDPIFGTDDTDIAFEAKDLENDVDDDSLTVRVNSIEQVRSHVPTSSICVRVRFVVAPPIYTYMFSFHLSVSDCGESDASS